MNEKLREKYIQNLDSIIRSYLAISSPQKSWVRDPETGDQIRIETEDLEIESYNVAYGFNLQAINAIWEVCPEQSIYHREATAIYQELGQFPHDFRLYNILCKVRDDLKLGFIGKISSLLHQEIFTDYLDMARHLLDEGYKDASAVIAGSTLESHLRQLCLTNHIDVTVPNRDGTTSPKRASRMNDDLKKNGLYSLYDQKMVTAQLDLRNNAAHGKYDLYTTDQVAKLINWLGDFIVRNPA